MSRPIAADCYLELEPIIEQYWNAGSYEDRVTGARVKRTTKSKPDNVGRNNVVVKVKLYVPDHMFLAGIPEAIVTVPDDPDESVTVTAQYQEE